MGRAPCCDKANVKKGPWSPEEDTKLKEYIEKYGTGGNWIALPQKAGLKRCGKSCRLRWLNYLRPNIKHGEFTDEEDRIICSLFATIGSRWSIIAAQLPGRTDNDIKNYWNTKLKKKLMAMSATPPQSQRKPPPFPPASSESLFSSLYKDCTTSYYNITTKPFTGFEPISSVHQSNLLHNTSTLASNNPSSFLQNPESLMSPVYYPCVKDNFLIFGGETSCSSSDGSCIQIKQEVDHHHMGGTNFASSGAYEDQTYKFMLSYGSSGGENVNRWNEKVNGYCGETQLDYDLEDVKQLISPSSTFNGSINTSNLLFIDESKTQEKVMYYHY
ncbi:hypothetical protein SLEP1_g20007 [Rubroshorea leprosula]|uniref:Uncharacterized protein n=1 Tax=Rubroshorea leprosula TaxID=152421 RepID=A0AAV5JBW6_9ROSI|nr:hypothetical protein SLEP1_g20007 [Rubroshorea leprosula]